MNTPEPLRVTRIRVSGLFGLYTHVVDLSQTDRVTIIHGPNGVGKTVLLRLVHALFSGRFSDCLKTTMADLEITLSNGIICGIRPYDGEVRANSGGDTESISRGCVYLQRDGNRQEGVIALDQKALNTWAARFADESPYFVRLEPGRWLDRRDDSVHAAVDILEEFGDRLPKDVRERIHSEPDWFVEIRQRVSVHIIETQRLLRFGRPGPAAPPRQREFVSTVNDYARDLSRRIRDALTNYARASQRLDQTFPRRLLEGPQAPFSVAGLKARMDSLEKTRERLMQIGLLDPDYIYPFNPATLDNVDLTKQNAMTLYVEDTAQKLGVFDDVARRIETLLTNVNHKFRNISISVSREEGLVALTKESRKLDLDALSSGEQHELASASVRSTV